MTPFPTRRSWRLVFFVLVAVVAAEVVWWVVGGHFTRSICSLMAIACLVGLVFDDVGWWRDFGAPEWWREWWRP